MLSNFLPAWYWGAHSSIKLLSCLDQQFVILMMDFTTEDQYFRSLVAEKVVTLFGGKFNHILPKISWNMDTLLSTAHPEILLKYMFPSQLLKKISLLDRLADTRDTKWIARTYSTNAKRDWLWLQWIKFLSIIERNKYKFLDSLSPTHQLHPNTRHLSKPLESKSFPQKLKMSWLVERAKRPWTKWQRSSKQTIGATPAVKIIIPSPKMTT